MWVKFFLSINFNIGIFKLKLNIEVDVFERWNFNFFKKFLRVNGFVKKYLKLGRGLLINDVCIRIEVDLIDCLFDFNGMLVLYI